LPTLARCKAGDVLVVATLDRLARSLGHLLEVIETPEGKGAQFRSLGDTSSLWSHVALQIRSAAEFERALIRERMKVGLASARKRGRGGGNSGLRQRAAMRINRIARAGDERHIAARAGVAHAPLSIVRDDG
jgi:DNA invertase Pin-like site-specific DNA recombinase